MSVAALKETAERRQKKPPPPPPPSLLLSLGEYDGQKLKSTAIASAAATVAVVAVKTDADIAQEAVQKVGALPFEYAPSDGDLLLNLMNVTISRKAFDGLFQLCVDTSNIFFHGYRKDIETCVSFHTMQRPETYWDRVAFICVILGMVKPLQNKLRPFCMHNPRNYNGFVNRLPDYIAAFATGNALNSGRVKGAPSPIPTAIKFALSLALEYQIEAFSVYSSAEDIHK